MKLRFRALKLGVLGSISILAALLSGCQKEQEDDVLTLRVCSWEEYIDLGDWDVSETIDLENKNIIGENSMIDDFVAWYKETTGKTVKVEYSCFGSNEELYNQLTLGDRFDLVCPSEYMIMKLMAEEELMTFSDSFFDETLEENYYARGVAPYIKNLTEEIQVNGESIARYAAGYMWGTKGIVYNPEVVSAEEASSWNVLVDDKYNHRITIKDNVRDSFFAAVGILKSKELLKEAERMKGVTDVEQMESYHDMLQMAFNDSSQDTIDKVENLLQSNKDNFYSFESDSGKADMITGKVVANYQWSGDAVYTLDQAEEDDYELCYAVPEEGSNLWFDGWVMLKDGIGEDKEKQELAEAFVNFLSMPDNVVRNMYYIGYTSVITGGEDSTVFEYADWCYAAEEEEDVVEYDLSYFFGDGTSKGEYVICATKDQLCRQLYAQYPPKEVLDRCVIMEYFGDKTNKKLNQMWINVRCFNPFQ